MQPLEESSRLLPHLRDRNLKTELKINVNQKFQEELYIKCFTINDKKVKFSPVNFLQKLLNKTILSWSSPYDSIILIAHQKSNWHNCKLSIVYRRPSLSTLVNLLTNHSKHSGNTWTTNIDVNQTYFIFLRQKYCKLSCNCTFTNSSFAWKHYYFMFDSWQFLSYNFDCWILLDSSWGTSSLIWTSWADWFFASLLRINSRTVFVGIFWHLFLHFSDKL